MSRSGNPYDNALAESFVATLKTECFDSIPPTKDAAKLMIFDYIETFHNPPPQTHRSQLPFSRRVAEREAE
jgi:transposase InsO family protein